MFNVHHVNDTLTGLSMLQDSLLRPSRPMDCVLLQLGQLGHVPSAGRWDKCVLTFEVSSLPAG